MENNNYEGAANLQQRHDQQNIEHNLQRNTDSINEPLPVSNKCKCGVVVLTILIPSIMLLLCTLQLVKDIDDPLNNYGYVQLVDVCLLSFSVLVLCHLLSKTIKLELNCRNFNIVRPILCVLCSFCILVVPTFKIIAITTCLHTQHGASEILGLFRNALACAFLLLQCIFIIFGEDIQCKSVSTSVMIMIVASTNAVMCVRSIIDTADQAVHANKNMFGNITEFCKDQSDWVSEGYTIVNRYFFTFVFMFCLYSVQVMCVRGHLFIFSNTRCRNRDETVPESRSLLPPERKRVKHKLGDVFAILMEKYVIQLMASLAVFAIFVWHFDIAVKNKEFKVPINETHLQKEFAFQVTQFVYVNFICGAAILGWIITRRKNVLQRSDVRPKHILLIFVSLFHFALVIAEIIDAGMNLKNHNTAMAVIFFVIKTIFHFVATWWQPYFILKTQDLGIYAILKYRKYFIRALLYFLAVSNLERAVSDILFIPAVYRHTSNIADDAFGIQVWRLLVSVLFPGVVFYRLLSSFLIFGTLLIKQRTAQKTEYQRLSDVSLILNK